MGKKVDPVAKDLRGNSGVASNGKWCLTGVSKELKDTTDRKESKAPRNRGA